jgi:hypothetical protein
VILTTRRTCSLFDAYYYPKQVEPSPRRVPALSISPDAKRADWRSISACSTTHYLRRLRANTLLALGPDASVPRKLGPAKAATRPEPILRMLRISPNISERFTWASAMFVAYADEQTGRLYTTSTSTTVRDKLRFAAQAASTSFPLNSRSFTTLMSALLLHRSMS